MNRQCQRASLFRRLVRTPPSTTAPTPRADASLPWQAAFVWPLALVLGLALLARRMMRRHVPFATSGFLAALLVAALSLGAFVFVFSLSRAPDFAWHLCTAMPRLLWIPTLLLALEILRLDASRES